MSNQTVYQLITDRIVSLLSKGVAPWRMTWSAGNGPAIGSHRNAVTGHVYTSTNALVTFATAMDRGYTSPLWLTFKQALALGGHVKKGEKGTPIIYASRMTVTDRAESGDIEQHSVPFLRYYTVFNVAQCEGLAIEIPAPIVTPSVFATIEACEQIVAAMPQRPEIEHSATVSTPVYNVTRDRVTMPTRERFEAEPFYYTALFHELTHSTGHTSRLNRREKGAVSFGCEAYAKEELVAELGAAFLCGVAGVSQPVIEDSASYVAGWLHKLKSDPRLFVGAAAQAQRAADFILGVRVAQQESIDRSAM